MDKRSIIRTIILIIALVNQILSSFGYSPLPIDDGDIETLVSVGFTIVISVWAWWKNNYISSDGVRQRDVLKRHGLYKK